MYANTYSSYWTRKQKSIDELRAEANENLKNIAAKRAQRVNCR
jgi:hypothetical protein